MRTLMLRAIIMVSLAALLTGCLNTSSHSPDDASQALPTVAFEPISLVRDPDALSVAPLPLAEAERVFLWPVSGRPSLVFVYDDGAT